MRNEGQNTYRRTGVPASDPSAAAARAGYEDWREHRQWPRGYETWPVPRQMTYEAGRRAAAVLSKHVALPPWPEDMTFAELFGHVTGAGVEAFLAEDAFTASQRTA